MVPERALTMAPRALSGSLAMAVVATLLAGCGAPPPDGNGPRSLVAALEWPTLSAKTTPSEPHEVTGAIQVTWKDGLFAIAAETEPQLRHRMVVSGQDVYVNQVPGMGWTRFRLADAVQPNNPRLVMWDLPRLVSDPEAQINATVDGETLNATVTVQVETFRGPGTVRTEIGAVGGRVVWARQETALDAEAPFTFRFDGKAFPFTPAVPQGAKTVVEVNAGIGPSQAGHRDVILLLKDYQKTHACQVPDEPSPESLRLELLTSQKEWPDNAYTGQPLTPGDRPGDFGWIKRGASDATYVGWGWDGALVSQTFGPNC